MFTQFINTFILKQINLYYSYQHETKERER